MYVKKNTVFHSELHTLPSGWKSPGSSAPEEETSVTWLLSAVGHRRLLGVINSKLQSVTGNRGAGVLV